MPDSPRLPSAAAFGVLLVRGVLLWIVVPVGAVGWAITGWRLRRRGATFGQFLGWLDLNLVGLIERSVLRPLVPKRLAWTPLQAMPTVTHRIRFWDLA